MPKTIKLYREDERYKDLYTLLSKAGYAQSFIDEFYLTDPDHHISSERYEEMYDFICNCDSAKLASQADSIANDPAESFSHSRYED